MCEDCHCTVYRKIVELQNILVVKLLADVELLWHHGNHRLMICDDVSIFATTVDANFSSLVHYTSCTVEPLNKGHTLGGGGGGGSINSLVLSFVERLSSSQSFSIYYIYM